MKQNKQKNEDISNFDSMELHPLLKTGNERIKGLLTTKTINQCMCIKMKKFIKDTMSIENEHNFHGSTWSR